MASPKTLAVWALLACACAREDAERHQLGGLVVVEDFDEPICAGTFAFLERRLAMLERETGLPRDPRGLIFHWIYERDEISSRCDELAGACAAGRDFYGQLESFSHELVHAHLSRLGRPRVWLSEGMAVMLEDKFLADPDPMATPSEMLSVDDARGLDDSSAGAFTAHLRDRYGMAHLLEYYEASAGADPESAVETFSDVFGDDFATVEADYLANFAATAVAILDCDVAEVAWSGDTWSHSFDLTCDDPSSIGPQQWIDDPKRSQLWSGVVLTASAGWFTFDLAASGPAWITILRCDAPEGVYLWVDEPRTDAYLTGGRYLVSADAFIDTNSSATVNVRRLEGAPDGAVVHDAGAVVHDASPPAFPRGLVGRQPTGEHFDAALGP